MKDQTSGAATSADVYAEALLQQYAGCLPVEQIREIARRVSSSNEIAGNILRRIQASESERPSVAEHRASSVAS